jgi:hypothetical protein
MSVLAEGGVTRTEAEVLDAVAQRLTNAEIAARLYVSEHTVERRAGAWAIEHYRRTSPASPDERDPSVTAVVAVSLVARVGDHRAVLAGWMISSSMRSSTCNAFALAVAAATAAGSSRALAASTASATQGSTRDLV